MIIEMRTYRIKACLRDHFIEQFLSRSVPALQALGMKVSQPLPSVEDPDVFFWMRGFPDLATRDAMKESFYEGPLWKNELEDIMMPMLERDDVVLVEADESAVQWLPASNVRQEAAA